jgi:sugar phosphate isomerase/epimerase
MSFPLCLNTSTIKPQPLLEKIRLAGEAGFDAIELWANDVYEHVGRGGEVRDVEHALADQGLRVPSIIAARGWAEAVDEEYPILRDEVKRRLELSARLGASWLVCSPPRMPCDLGQITARYRDLLELARDMTVKPTFEYISFFRSISQLKQAWQVVVDANDPDATVIVDAFHSYNSFSTLDELRAIPGNKISHYHIDDAHPNIPAGRQLDPDRVMLGEGPIDLRAEIQVLREIGYQGAISLELFNEELWQRDPREVLKIGIERMRELL